MIKPIIQYDNDLENVLTCVSKEIDMSLESERLLANQIIEDLEDTAKANPCLGLAAPQIGYGYRIFKTNFETFVNPTIRSESSETLNSVEGCMSIRDIRFNVVRNQNIVIDYFDKSLMPQSKSFESLEAVVIQHEYDHLNGVLISNVGTEYINSPNPFKNN